MPRVRQALPPLLAGAAVAALAIGLLRYPGTDAPAVADAPAAAPAAPAAPPPVDAAMHAAVLGRLAAEHAAALADRDAEIARLQAGRAADRASLARLEARVAELEAALAELEAADPAAAALAATPLDVEKFLGGPGEALPAALADPAAFALAAPRLSALTLAPAAAPAEAAEAGARVPLAEVHFERASAALTPGAARRARDAAVAIAVLAPLSIRVAGHADRTGPPAVNARLSRLRAEAVAAVLVAAGIPAEAIEIVGFGAEPDHLPVPTDPGITEPLNRSVAIWIEEAPA